MGEAVGRLKLRSEFLQVAATRRKWAAPGLVLQVRDNPPAGDEAAAIRVGFTVSRKVGNSVKRNRARRRLKAAAAQVMPRDALPGHDYVVIGRQETLRRPFSLLLQDFQTALKRVGAFRARTANNDGGGDGADGAVV